MAKATNPAIEFVRLGYGDLFGVPFRSLDFLAEFSNLSQAAEAIRLVESYNDFNGVEVADALLALQRNDMVGRVEFGREYSPVLYLHVPWQIVTGSGGKGRQLTEQERGHALVVIKKIMKQLKADEIDVRPGDVIRAWWD